MEAERHDRIGVVDPVEEFLAASVQFGPDLVLGGEERQGTLELDSARVRFYPNGTCDELSATLLSGQNELRRLTLEISTGRTDVEVLR